MARFDASGAAVFGDSSVEAWFSFTAAIIVAPMVVVWVIIDGFGTPDGTPLLTSVFYEAMTYGIGWLLFPVIAWHVLVFLDRTDGYPRFVAAYNWTAVIQNGLFLTVHLVLMAIGAPEEARALMGMLMLSYVLMYSWFVARTILGIEAGAAVMIVTLDFVVALVWEGFTSNMIGS